jgi:tetratricopeptide (TPR) repeat protein
MQQVKIWEEVTFIPTYEVGEPEKNPLFIDQRVYQGSTGKVYPYPVIEKIKDIKTEKPYQAIYIENEYLKVMVLPELGGRIQRAYDKTNDYDFVYYNQVIKPALVGLTGPWISGGIEFNWPQHHRPSTFLPVEYTLKSDEDGSSSVLLHDVDRINGTKSICEIRLYPDKAYIEIRGQLYNRTPFAQTFLWWANPAVAVNEHTQSVFPPDVHAVMDHGKRDVSRFPIATGVYYKHDYSEGVDISRYKNIPVPTSYMAEKSDYDFVGGYDYGKEAGLLHVADHHISPGKKQWTWGCGDFGKAWDQNLTDEDGPYIELMTGVYTDNQPDFTWLKPFEEKTFTQYFMPYKHIGYVKNATTKAAVNVEVEEGSVRVRAYATSAYDKVSITLTYKGQIVLCESVPLSPVQTYDKTIVCQVQKAHDLKCVIETDEESLVAYTPPKKTIEPLPEPAKPAKEPEEIFTNEELYLTGLHIEQYRHATYLPDPYYLEGLKRDAGDSRINQAYGNLLLRRGLFKEATGYFKKAIARLTDKNPNPYNSEAYYLLGLALLYQNKPNEAFDAFYKATWSSEQQEMSFYYLAALCARKKEFKEALAFVCKSLIKNSHNMKARGLKALLLERQGYQEEGNAFIAESLKIDPFDTVCSYVLTKDPTAIKGGSERVLQTARDLLEAGFTEEARCVLAACKEEKPLLKYYEGYCLDQLGRQKEAIHCFEEAEKRDSAYTFPNQLEDLVVLSHVLEKNTYAPKAAYYLGNLYYDKLQYEKAIHLWELSVEQDPLFPTSYRNLALAYYNHKQLGDKAKESLEKAFKLDSQDARVFLELDQLYKRQGKSPEERLAFYKTYPQVFIKRDDLVVEYITLHNLLGLHEEAYSLLQNHLFHPWEGGEGKVTTQYTTALVALAKAALHKKDNLQAKNLLDKALVYPKNLGEGKLEGAKDNDIYYLLGLAYEGLKQDERAMTCFEKAARGAYEPKGVMYYNDQPAEFILYQGLALVKLGLQKEGFSRFYKLIEYGERHLFDEVKTEYFAVSLPDFLIFKDDLTLKNKVHCYYLISLGHLGLGNTLQANQYLEKVYQLDPYHLNGRLLYQTNNGANRGGQHALYNHLTQ